LAWAPVYLDRDWGAGRGAHTHGRTSSARRPGCVPIRLDCDMGLVALPRGSTYGDESLQRRRRRAVCAGGRLRKVPGRPSPDGSDRAAPPCLTEARPQRCLLSDDAAVQGAAGSAWPHLVTRCHGPSRWECCVGSPPALSAVVGCPTYLLIGRARGPATPGFSQSKGVRGVRGARALLSTLAALAPGVSGG